MPIAATTPSIVPMLAEAQQEHRGPLPVRLRRFLSNGWQHHRERQVEWAIRQLGHDGVFEDFRMASGG